MISVSKVGATHVQEVPATEWVFEHKLKRTAIVDVYINFQGRLEKILPLSVQQISPDETRIVFSDPQTGVARAV